MKKHNLRCGYCGCDRHISKFFLMLQLIIQGRIYVRCSNCGLVSNYILVSHIVHDTVDLKEKELNSQYNKNQKELWKKG